MNSYVVTGGRRFQAIVEANSAMQAAKKYLGTNRVVRVSSDSTWDCWVRKVENSLDAKSSTLYYKVV